jgi:hypothetical protein
MNWKWYRRNRSWISRVTISAFAWSGWGQLRKATVNPQDRTCRLLSRVAPMLAPGRSLTSRRPTATAPYLWKTEEHEQEIALNVLTSHNSLEVAATNSACKSVLLFPHSHRSHDRQQTLKRSSFDSIWHVMANASSSLFCRVLCLNPSTAHLGFIVVLSVHVESCQSLPFLIT